jgi:hypothetical protein
MQYSIEKADYYLSQPDSWGESWYSLCDNTIIKKLAAYALAYYDEGFDTFYECYDLAKWEDFVDNDGAPYATYEEALEELKKLAGVYETKNNEMLDWGS